MELLKVYCFTIRLDSKQVARSTNVTRRTTAARRHLGDRQVQMRYHRLLHPRLSIL